MEQVQKLVEEYENRIREEAHLLGLNEGERRGLDKGKKLGLDEGTRAGKVEEARKAVERVLRRRGLPLSEAQTAQLADCHDLDTLERWLDLAITAASTDEALR
jgi:flagellar biosynthesis/type III secretory pathway protein FliH